jgi:hypothetical protein
VINDNGSPNTVIASGNDTPCFRSLAIALRRFQVKSIDGKVLVALASLAQPQCPVGMRAYTSQQELVRERRWPAGADTITTLPGFGLAG